LRRARACWSGTPFAAVATRGFRASRDDPIRRRGSWRSFVIDRPYWVTGPSTPLLAPSSWYEAERLVP